MMVSGFFREQGEWLHWLFFTTILVIFIRNKGSSFFFKKRKRNNRTFKVVKICVHTL